MKSNPIQSKTTPSNLARPLTKCPFFFFTESVLRLFCLFVCLFFFGGGVSISENEEECIFGPSETAEIGPLRCETESSRDADGGQDRRRRRRVFYGRPARPTWPPAADRLQSRRQASFGGQKKNKQTSTQIKREGLSFLPSFRRARSRSVEAQKKIIFFVQ